MIFNDSSLVGANVGGNVPLGPIYDGFTPIVAYDFTDPTTVSESGNAFLGATPVAQSEQSDNATVYNGTPQYYPAASPPYVDFINDGVDSILKSISTPTAVPSRMDQTVIFAIERPLTLPNGYAVDSLNGRTGVYFNGESTLTAYVGGSAFATTPIATDQGKKYMVALTGSLDQATTVFTAEIGQATVKTPTAYTPASGTYPAEFILGARNSTYNVPYTDMKMYTFARFSSILSDADIQTIFDRIAARF